MPKVSHALLAFSLIVSLFVFVEIVVSDNANFILGPQREQVITLSLQETDSVSGSFSVVSSDDTGVNFFISDPGNQTILSYNNTKHEGFSFIAQITGNYLLHFNNLVPSDSSKTVAFNYNVTHYIMGLPQEQFLLIVIAIAALIGVVIYVALMPK